MPTKEELEGQLQAALADKVVAQYERDVLAKKRADAQAPGLVVKDYPVRTVEPTTKLEDITHREDNPVQRPRGAAVTCAKLDLEQERGFLAVSKAGAATRLEYTSWAPAVSYLHDAVACLVEQCNAPTVPEAQRKAIAVGLSALEAVLGYSVERLDLLKLKGEKNSQPLLVEAVTELMEGHGQELPISSSNVKKALQRAADLHVAATMKAAAKSKSGKQDPIAKPGAS
jgi:hypothetical protein